MADWTFTQQYGSSYPALENSVLGLLVFSDHSLDGDKFSGTMSVASSGAALATLGLLVNLPTIPVTGTVTDANGTLTVALETARTLFADGISKAIPLLGQQVTESWLGVLTVVLTSDNAGDGPQTDAVELKVRFTVGNYGALITTQIPMNGGLFSIAGTFENVSVTLGDLSNLLGGGDWFPAKQLGPYGKGALSLLGITLDLYVTLSPFSVAVSSVTAGLGLVGFPIIDQKMYLDPLGVWITVANSRAAFAIEGNIAVCNWEKPGKYQEPDFAFDMALGVPEFTFSGELDNSKSVTINTMLKDLIGPSADIGLPATLTLDRLSFDAAADSDSGSLSDFSFEIAMSGGFGIFGPGFGFESISIALEYTA